MPRRPFLRAKDCGRLHRSIENAGDHLGVLVAIALVFDAAGDRGDAASFKHAALLIDAEVHPALDDPHELLVRM